MTVDAKEVERLAGASGYDPSMSRRISLMPLRVLVVEDEFLIASALAEQLADEGLAVLGPIPTLEDGIEQACQQQVDVALLDIALDGRKTSFAIADILADRGIPFIFLSGYHRSVLPPHLANRPLLAKPVRIELIAAALRRALTGPPMSGRPWLAGARTRRMDA
jgi:CheY-like chemotaxis protein